MTARAITTTRILVVVELIQAGLLAANLGWTTLCLGGYRPETMVITSTLTGLLLVLHLAGRAVCAEAGLRIHPAGWLFLPFLLYATVNVLWITPVPWLGRHDWLWWAQMVAVYWVVLNWTNTPAGPRILLGALALLGFMAVVLAAYQIFVQPDWLMLGRQQAEQFIGRASGPFGIPNSLAALLLLLLPPMVAATLRPGASMVQRVLCGYLAGVYFFGLVLTASRGAWIALGLTLLGWPLLVGRRSWAWRMGRLALVGLVLIVMAMAVFLTMPTLRTRFETMVQEAGERTRPIMWRGAWQLFLENPVWGSGAGSYNVAFEKHRPAQYQLDSQWVHNDYLNTLSDYGAVGFGLFFAACGLVIIGCIRRGVSQPPGRASPDEVLADPLLWHGIALGLLAFSLQLVVDFHFKIPALAMALAIMAGLLVKRCWPLPATMTATRETGRRMLHLGVGIAITAGLILLVVPHYRAEAWRYAARQAIDKLSDRETADYQDTLVPVRAAFTRAVAIDPANAQAWADLAYATSLWAHVEIGQTLELGREAERYANHALALTRVIPEFWLRQAVALDMQGRWIEAGDSCVQAMQLAPSHALVWYHYAYHLSLNPVGLPQSRAALAICLRLDPGNRPAQLLRQQLAARETSR